MASAETPRPGTGWLLLGYAGLAGFFALEATTRQRGSASSLVAADDDRGTTRSLVLAYAVGASSAPVLRRVPPRPLPAVAAPAGVVLQALGLGLRGWSMRALGRSYSRTLRSEDGQQLVRTGPYRYIRHPGYAGSLLTWSGFSLTTGSPAVVALVGGLIGRAYARRIAAEELLLRRDLAGYEAYAATSKRLVPGVW